MRIDAHMHLWRLERGDYGWITDEVAPIKRDFGPEDARPLIEAAGIDGVVLVQAAPTVAETRFLLEHAGREPWVRGVVGWIDMEALDAVDVLAALANDPMLKGIRPMIQDIPDVDWMLGGSLGPAFRALVAHDLVFDALVKPEHLANLRRLLERHPDLRVVIDHGAKPAIRDGAFEPWATHMATLARETGAFCKLSGLVTEAGPSWTLEDLRPYVDHLLGSFGPERLLFGSDWPVLTLAGDHAGWCRAAGELLSGLAPAERELVFGETARRVYRLR